MQKISFKSWYSVPLEKGQLSQKAKQLMFDTMTLRNYKSSAFYTKENYYFNIKTEQDDVFEYHAKTQRVDAQKVKTQDIILQRIKPSSKKSHANKITQNLIKNIHKAANIDFLRDDNYEIIRLKKFNGNSHEYIYNAHSNNLLAKKDFLPNNEVIISLFNKNTGAREKRMEFKDSKIKSIRLYSPKGKRASLILYENEKPVKKFNYGYVYSNFSKWEVPVSELEPKLY